MTPNKLLLICLAVTVMQGCAGHAKTSTERILKVEKSSSYHYNDSIESVANKIMNYIDVHEAHPESTREVISPGYYDIKNKFFYPDTRSSYTDPEVKSHIEIYPKSRRVSLVEGDNFKLVMDVTKIDRCKTSVEFYDGNSRLTKKIDQYIKTEEFDAACLESFDSRPSITSHEEVLHEAAQEKQKQQAEAAAPAIQPAVIKSEPVVSSIVEDSTVKTPQPQSGNAVQRLKDLKALYEEGLINKKDFGIKKQEILKAM